MFTMMNLERIVVGVQGLGIAETAYQNAVAYSKREKARKSKQQQKWRNRFNYQTCRHKTKSNEYEINY